MKIGVEVTSYVVRRSSGYAINRADHFEPPNFGLDGEVVTPYGIVRVWSEDWRNAHTGKRYRTTGLRFVVDGREYHLIRRDRALRRRGLVTAAERFAREVVDGMWD